MRSYNNEYDQQARDFLTRTGAKMKICREQIVDRFPGDERATGYRWQYRVTIKRDGRRSYSFRFFDSVNSYRTDERPRPYDILAYVEKYEPAADAWDFADEYGYEIDSRESFRRVDSIRRACEKQYKRLSELFDAAEMDELREIA